MAATPTILELYNGILQNLETELEGSISVFGKRFLPAFAMVQAAKLKLQWLAIANLKKNMFPDTGDYETIIRFGLMKLGRTPFVSTQGVYTVEVRGAISSVIDSGTLFKSNDDASVSQKIFQLDTEKTLISTIDSIQLRALEGGIISRLQVGDKLTSVSPLSNIDDEVTVTIEDTIPLDSEDIEVFRGKVLEAFRTEAQGGAAGDYRLWTDVQGLRKIYPYTKSSEAAAVNIYVEATTADSTDGFGTPSAQLLLDVQSVVELDPDTTIDTNIRGRRPLGIKVYYLAVVPKNVVVTIDNPVGIDVDTETVIDNSLDLLFFNIRPHISAADLEADKNNTLSKNEIISNIQGNLSSGQSFETITVTVDGTPLTTSIIFSNGDIPYLGTLNV